METKDRLCLALDVPTLSEAEGIVRELKGLIGVFKIGMQLFTAEGPRAVKTIRRHGGRVFLDLKYHDIPNTVASAGREATKLGVNFFTIHASGGLTMMRAVAESVRQEAERQGGPKPTILAITVLTSLSTRELRRELSIDSAVKEQVEKMAKLTQAAGVDGVVASPREIRAVRKTCGDGFVILTPGIRPEWAADKSDQRRTMSPKEAIRAGANYVVIGRPILGARDRVEACRKVLQEMDAGLGKDG